MRPTVIVAMILAASPALAQTSASYKLEETVLNAGGDPAQGSFATSASYRIRQDSIGEGAIGPGLASASYRVDGGFISAYAPPGEVASLQFTPGGTQTLTWNPESSIGSYALYRDLMGNLPLTYGACLQSGLGSETATDASAPTSRQAYFYLVTARNRLGEEGTKGFQSNGLERPNGAPCP